MPGGRPKGYLRTQLAGILPPAVMNRPKSGFQIDSPSFFRERLMTVAKDLLCDSVTRQFGLFNPNFVRQTLALSAVRRHRWHYFILMLMLGTHLWMMAFDGTRATQH
jgi:asparagine synthase (glutamine-hydrolysing)